MIYTEDLVNFVAAWEGMRLTAYQDGGGVWTIGAGHTRGVREGAKCTRVQALRWLRCDLIDAEVGVQAYMKRKPTQQQYDALVSIAFNCGYTAIGRSGLMARFNEGLDNLVADRFLLWNKDNGVVVPGLTKRRKAERAMYLHGDYSMRP